MSIAISFNKNSHIHLLLVSANTKRDHLPPQVFRALDFSFIRFSKSIGFCSSVSSMEGGGEPIDGGAAITTGLEVDGSDAITVIVQCINGTKFSIQVSLESSVESFKSEIAKNCDIPAERQSLVHKGLFLKDEHTLKSYGLEAEHTVHLIPSPLPAASNNTENTVKDGTLDGSGGSLPNRPMRTEMMYQLIYNSEALRNTALSIPHMREAINRDPHISHIFSDPVIFRVMTEVTVIHEIIERVRAAAATPRHPAGTDRFMPPVGLGGLGIQVVEKMFGFNIDANSISQLMQDPAISHMIQRIFSDTTNPVLNPQYWEIWRNPVRTRESISQLTSPEIMPQMMALHHSLSYLLGPQQSTRHVGETSGGTVGPEELYARQIAQLQEWGFSDARKNLEALVATAGDIRKAVHHLLGI